MKVDFRKLKKSEFSISLSCVAVFLCLLGVVAYSAGYGREVNGVVSYSREPLIKSMIADYRRDGGEWSFGYFVPIAVGVLLWLRRKDIFGTEVNPATGSGIVLLFFGFLIYWAGYRGEQKYFGYASLQIIVLGSILWFLGWAWFRKLFWLWVLLGMMWPWRFLIDFVSHPLQTLMVKLTTSFMNLVGVEAISNGSSLRTASLDPITRTPISMDVDVACSGMRSLFALLMIGLIFSFLRVKEEWKRWLLMALVPVLAILGNFVRMLMLYGGSLAWGSKVAIGEGHDVSTFHTVAGLVVFVVVLLLMSGVVMIIERRGLPRFRMRRKVIKRSVVTPAVEGGGE